MCSMITFFSFDICKWEDWGSMWSSRYRQQCVRIFGQECHFHWFLLHQCGCIKSSLDILVDHHFKLLSCATILASSSCHSLSLNTYHIHTHTQTHTHTFLTLLTRWWTKHTTLVFIYYTISIIPCDDFPMWYILIIFPEYGDRHGMWRSTFV